MKNLPSRSRSFLKILKKQGLLNQLLLSEGVDPIEALGGVPKAHNFQLFRAGTALALIFL